MGDQSRRECKSCTRLQNVEDFNIPSRTLNLGKDYVHMWNVDICFSCRKVLWDDPMDPQEWRPWAR